MQSAVRWSLPAGPFPAGLVLGDLDGDSRLDLITTNFDSREVTVRLGLGGGHFALRAACAEAAGNDDAGNRAQRAGQFVRRDRLRVDPDDLWLDLVPEAGMGQ